MKWLTAIDESGSGTVLGNLVYAIVRVDNITLKKMCKLLPIKKAHKLTKKQIKKVVEESLQHYGVNYYVYKIKPTDLSNTDCEDELRIKAVIDLLNKLLRFYEEDVYIDNWMNTRKRFMEMFRQYLPANLKSQKFNKLHVENFADKNHKIVALADIFAKYYSLKEREENKIIYGIGDVNPEKLTVLNYFLQNYKNPTPIMNTKNSVFEKFKNPKYRKNLRKLIKEAKNGR